MNILLTGGAGFIGSNILEFLITQSNVKKIIILDNLSTGYFNNIEKFKNNDKFIFVNEDISNFDICLNIMKKYKINYVCHQAALGSVPRSIKNPLNSHKSNVTGFLNILYAMVKCNIKRIVYASSSSVYGDINSLPKVEGLEGNLLSPYAGTKAICEIYAKIFGRVYGLETIGLRYFNVFGPRQNPNGEYAAVIPRFINGALKDTKIYINGDGLQSRDFTFVENVILANWLALTNNNSGSFNKVFNVGCNKKINLLGLINQIETILDKKINYEHRKDRNGDIKHSLAAIDNVKDLLGYKVKINFNEGLKKTINYYKLKNNI